MRNTILTGNLMRRNQFGKFSENGNTQIRMSQFNTIPILLETWMAYSE